MTYTVYDITGRILRSGHCAPADVALQATGAERVISVSSNDDLHYVDVATQQIVEKPSKPSAHHSFDYTAKAWVIHTDALEKAKSARLRLINAEREKAIDSLVVQSGGREYRADRLCYGIITGALATASEGFEWCTVSNDTVLFSIAELHDLAVSMKDGIGRIYKQSWDREGTINAASTLEQVDSVIW